MGTKITELLSTKEISIDDLKGKVIVVDAFNQLYMFLASIRQPDGSLLKDSNNNVTSHLNGLFYRFTKLMQHDMRFIFVFDGKAPDLKLKERARRSSLKEEAQLKYEEAREKEDTEEMRKYAARTSRLTPEMIADAKELIDALGFPIIQAPSEGEAQAALIVKSKDAYASLSQDADSLIFGCPLVVKNLTLSGRRKQPGKLNYDLITPEIIFLDETLQNLQIDIDQLIVVAMLTGTDYNIGGIKGIGHKTMSNVIAAGARGIEIVISGKIPGNRAKSWRFYAGYLKKCGDISISGVKHAYSRAELKTGTIGIKEESKNVAILRRLFVSPNYRGKGYGLALIDKALDFSLTQEALQHQKMGVYFF